MELFDFDDWNLRHFKVPFQYNFEPDKKKNMLKSKHYFVEVIMISGYRKEKKKKIYHCKRNSWPCSKR